MKQYKIAVVGATGMVGRMFLRVLEERKLPVSEYFLFASERSAGTEINFMGKTHIVRELTPDATTAFLAFSGKVFAAGALDAKAKQIIAVAVAHVTQCQQCIRSHTRSALRAGATPQELMEAAWVAAEMRAGGAYAHSNVMLAAINEEQSTQGDQEGRS